MAAAGLRPLQRQALAATWRLAGAAPGEPAPAPDAAAWKPIAGPLTVAAALRDRGEWSLDAPPLDFDAQDWWYHASFDHPSPGEPVHLGFDGLATLAEVTLNGEPLFASDNMFRAHEADCGARLREHGNELVLRFRALAPELARRRPRPRWRTPMVAHQQLRWIRTTLLGRTPGWSPPAAPVGPWREIGWSRSSQRLQVRLRAGLHAGDGEVSLELHAGPAWAGDIEAADLVVSMGGQVWRAPLHRDTGLGVHTARVLVPRPARWWPHTHGEPQLHEASLRVTRRDGRVEEHALGRIGFRRIEIDTTGGGFAVRVNGDKVFCRGAGWTPLDPASLRADDGDYRDAIRQAASAGMNMLRLAGTLVYEQDAFYDACDELGVLVWQDFMFASMDYPLDDPAFAASAAQEARQQLRRLGHHACLAVLCGNSEVEQQAAMWGAPRELWQPRFFHEALPALCAAEAGGIPYWPSSAHGGAFPHVADTGTTSYYGVGAYERPLDDARRSQLKFATECLAFANVPAPSTLERLPGGLATRVHHPAWKARSPRDLGAGWDFDDVRDHYVQRLFGVDPARLRHADHDRYLSLGRLATAHAMEAAFSEWRRPASDCGGALLLFLRDLWAGAGWGVLDEQGAPKAAWHALRRALRPLAVLLTDEGGNGLAVHAINDGPQGRGLVLEVAAWRDGDVRVAEGRMDLHLPPRSAQTVSCIEVLGQFLDLNHAYRFGPPACDAVVARLREGEAVLAEQVHFPVGLAGLLAAPRRDIGLSAKVEPGAEGHATVHAATRELAIGVHVDVPGWCADDEHFHLAPSGERRIALRRTRPGAPLAGSLLALNTTTAVPVEAFE